MNQTKLFPTVKDLADSGFLFRIQDSGPKTIDRITAVFCDGDYLALSQNGLGFSQWVENIDPQLMAIWAESDQAVDLALGDISEELRNHILFRLNEGFADLIEEIEKGNPKYVAASRDTAEEHEGLRSSIGQGIYKVNGQYFIRVEADESEDRGPYQTAREAVYNTLPDDYSMCGPEYHPEINVASLEPTPGVAEKIAALEERESA